MSPDPRTITRLADTLVELAGELRKLDGSSGTGLQLLPESSKGADVKPTPALLNVTELADYLSCNARTLRRWRHQRLVPKPVKIGGALRWRRADVDAWIERGGRS